MLVTFEGIDGVGKSTQITLLSKYYKNSIVTKEPGGTQFGKILRSLILGENFKISLPKYGEILLNLNEICGDEISKNAETFLFLADRAEHYEKVISKNNNKLILCDRGFVSGVAYAMANDENYDFSQLVNLNKVALKGNFGDKFIFLKIDEENLIKRLEIRPSMDNIELRGIKYLMKVQENIEHVLKELQLDFIAIDATLEIGEIFKQIKEFIR